jgi:hypothetical protein
MLTVGTAPNAMRAAPESTRWLGRVEAVRCSALLSPARLARNEAGAARDGALTQITVLREPGDARRRASMRERRGASGSRTRPDGENCHEQEAGRARGTEEAERPYGWVGGSSRASFESAVPKSLLPERGIGSGADGSEKTDTRVNSSSWPSVRYRRMSCVLLGRFDPPRREGKP